jgi:glycosyltransferase involved in cell wall biosynthesis
LAGSINLAVNWAAISTPVPQAVPIDKIQAGPLIVSGFLSEVLGLGTVARITVAQIAAAGYSPVEHDIAFLRHMPIYQDIALPGGPGGVWIAHMNPPELNRLLFMMRGSRNLNRYRIGYWAWELARLPDDWSRTAKALNEIWTPSRFVQAAVRRALPPHRHDAVKVLPHPIEPKALAEPPGLDFPPGMLTVLVMADFRSTSLRKNPIGAIKAFRRAFPTPTKGVRLVCKLVAADTARQDYQSVRAATAGREDIHFLERRMTDAEVLGLIERSDVLLSLHRSEGYGLTMAEAMRLGRCVVATGWSGNMDFMDSNSAVLTPYRLVPVEGNGPYGGLDSEWAEPDVEFAANALRALIASPEMRARLGAAARDRIAAHKAEFSDFVKAAPWRSLIYPEARGQQAV